MRKKTFFLILLLFLAFGLKAQSNADTSKILKICFSMSDFQDLYPKTNGIKQINVMQHGVSFSNDSKPIMSSSKVSYFNKAQIANNGIKDYFLFWKFDITAIDATVEFSYNYGPGQKQVSLKLVKENNVWILKNN
jgi:hypothetical protein